MKSKWIILVFVICNTIILKAQNNLDANFSSDFTSICVNQTVQFTDLSIGSPTSWQWHVDTGSQGYDYNFQNGTTTASQNPKIKFFNPGNYTISLTIYNSNGSHSITKSNFIITNSYISPSISISTPYTTICPGSEVNFTAISTNGGSNPTFQWKINGNNVGTNSSIFTSTSINNNDAISCQITSNASCLNYSTNTSSPITIHTTNSIQNFATISTSSSVACENTPISFYANTYNSSLNQSFQWQVDGVNAGINSPSFSSSNLNSGQQVKCIVSSSSSCATPSSFSTPIIQVQILDSNVINLPYSEGFENNFPPQNCVISNLNNDYVKWIQNNFYGMNSNKSAYIVNNSNTDGRIDELILPKFSLLNLENATLKFDVAYARKSANWVDSLIVQGSNDCGNTWINLYQKGNFLLPTAPDQTTGVFFPNSNQWRSETIDLSIFNNSDVVILKFKNISGVGQPIYIDNINISTPPVASIIINHTGTNPSCEGELLTFQANTVNSGSNPIFIWKINGQVASNSNSEFTSSLLNNGDTISCMMISNLPNVLNDTSFSDSIILEINPTVFPSVSLPLVDTLICFGDSIQLSAIYTNGGNNPTFDWYINNQLMNEISNQITINNLQENSNINCVINSSENCFDQNSIVNDSMIINIQNSVAPYGENIQSFCNSGVINDLIVNGDNITWYDSEVMDNVLSENTELTNNTNYYATQTQNGCESHELFQVQVKINPNPIVTLSSFPDLCSNDEVLDLNQGFPIGGEYSGLNVENNMFDPTSAIIGINNINYSYTDINGCSNSVSGEILVSDCASLTNIINDAKLNIYPNPSNGKFLLHNLSNEITKIELIDFTGKLVKQINIHLDRNSQHIIDFSSLENGSYSLKIYSNGTITTEKIIIM